MNCVPCCDVLGSPENSGASDNPPSARGGSGSGGSSAGGSGSAGQSLGGSNQPRQSCNASSSLANLLSKFGTSIATAITGAKTVTSNVLPTVAHDSAIDNPFSTNAMLLTLVVVGGILLFLSFGKGE